MSDRVSFLQLEAELEALGAVIKLMRDNGCTSLKLPGFEATFAPPMRFVEATKKDPPLPASLMPKPEPAESETPVEQRRRERAQIMERING